MRHHVHTQVLVVGAGPVGMFTALRLAESGVEVELIDQAAGATGRSYACVLHPRSLQLLHESGIADDAIRLGRRVDKIAFYEGALRRAELNLSRLPVDFPFALVLEQSRLEELLEQKLAERAGVKIQWNHRLAGLETRQTTPAFTLEELEMEGKGYAVPHFEKAVRRNVTGHADFIVGADGQGSIVRKLLGIDHDAAGEARLFVVYELETGAKLPAEISIVLGPQTAAAFLPLAGNRCRWSFEWNQPDASTDFPLKDRSHFTVAENPGEGDSRHHLQNLLRVHAPWFQEDIQDVVWAVDVQFEPWLARQFGRDRVWLAGDAAHQTGPIGVQSMNVGFREGANLAAKMAQIIRAGGSLDLLDAYNRESRAEWEMLLGLKGVLRSDTAIPWVREHGYAFLASLPASGSDMTFLLRQLGLELLDSNPQPAGAAAA